MANLSSETIGLVAWYSMLAAVAITRALGREKS